MEIPLQKSSYTMPVDIGKTKCINTYRDFLACLGVTLGGSKLLAFIFEF